LLASPADIISSNSTLILLSGNDEIFNVLPIDSQVSALSDPFFDIFENGGVR
jgi:hypothetical protein